MDIKNFLKLKYNQSWNLDELLIETVKILHCHGVIFFVRDDAERFVCKTAISLTGKDEKDFQLNSYISDIKIIDDVSKVITSKLKLKSVLIIPITENGNKIISYICYWDKYDFIYFELIEEYIVLLELLSQKEQLITDFRKLEKNNLSGFTKTLFLANISHEIRTPLNGIVGYAQLLSQTQLNETQETYITSLNKCSIQLLQIMNDILDFSKLSSGKMVLNEEYFDVKSVVEIVRDTLATKIYEKKQLLDITLQTNVPKYIISDKNKIIQILVNLVSNANKFTKVRGFISINIDLKEPEILEFCVSDNGIGISETDQYKLFNSFVQLENSKYKTGTGLGLYICKKLCELLGGDISLTSCLGKGSQFKFTIRFEEYEKLKLKNEVLEDFKIFKDKHILVVDDNADNRIVISNYLTDIGCIPIVCESALEALRIFLNKRYPIELGLIDIHMPGVSGEELAKMIKEDFPFFKLVALSSYDSIINLSLFECKIDKPIDKISLYNALYIVLKKTEKEGNLNKLETRFSHKSKENYKFLIAEDIEYNSSMLASMLNNLGYKSITKFSDGLQLINFIEKNKTQLENTILLLDLIMPLKDGYDVLQYLKENSITLQVIVVTASVLEEAKTRCLDLGVTYFLNKPIKFKDLNQMISVIISDKF